MKQSELAHEQKLSINITHTGLPRFALSIGPKLDTKQSSAAPLGTVRLLIIAQATQNQQAPTDAADNGPIHCHGGRQHSLNHKLHRSSFDRAALTRFLAIARYHRLILFQTLPAATTRSPHSPMYPCTRRRRQQVGAMRSKKKKKKKF
jgi:hypothetical protein